LQAVLNNTKWDELRLAMYGLGNGVTRWRTKDLSGHISPWDGEWFYHFRDGGYESIEWAEIEVLSPTHNSDILKLLREIHLPGHRIDRGFRIYGHLLDGEAIEYI
jgi:hypothetical protein